MRLVVYRDSFRGLIFVLLPLPRFGGRGGISSRNLSNYPANRKDKVAELSQIVVHQGVRSNRSPPHPLS